MAQASEQTKDGHNDASPSESETPNVLTKRFVMGVLIAAGGLVTTGIAVYVLDRIVSSPVADLVWLLGYGGTIFALWYLLVRPIDFSE